MSFSVDEACAWYCGCLDINMETPTGLRHPRNERRMRLGKAIADGKEERVVHAWFMDKYDYHGNRTECVQSPLMRIGSVHYM